MPTRNISLSMTTPPSCAGKLWQRGWKDAEHVEIALPVSSWIEQIRPEFKAEFFRPDGDMICGNGNVDLVQALLAGRDILRDKS